MHEIISSEFLSLGIFKPCAYIHEEMDDVVVITEDTSLVTLWFGLVSIEHVCSDKNLKGFNLLGAKRLQGKKGNIFVPFLLFSAFYFDARSSQHTHSFISLFRLYVGPLALLARHPSTWWLK
jgi:hypothetical protein